MPNCKIDEKKLLHTNCNLKPLDSDPDSLCLLHSELEDKDIEAFYSIVLDKIKNDDFNFEAVVFPETIRFEVDWNFNYKVNFFSAIFKKDAIFFRTIFDSKVDFSESVFYGNSNFISSKFMDGVDFFSVNFYGEVKFWSTIFSGEINFTDVDFYEKADFISSQFKNNADVVFSVSGIFKNYKMPIFRADFTYL